MTDCGKGYADEGQRGKLLHFLLKKVKETVAGNLQELEFLELLVNFSNSHWAVISVRFFNTVDPCEIRYLDSKRKSANLSKRITMACKAVGKFLVEVFASMKASFHGFKIINPQVKLTRHGYDSCERMAWLFEGLSVQRSSFII